MLALAGAQGRDAFRDLAVDGPLDERHEHELRRENHESDKRHEGAQIGKIAEDAAKDADLKQRFGHARAHEGSDRIGFGEHDRNLRALRTHIVLVVFRIAAAREAADE